MNKESLAAQLNNRALRSELSSDEEAAAAQAGLVVVFGASDDLMEFRGAISDELGVYDGGIALVDAKGLLDRAQIDDDDDDAIADFVSRKRQAVEIEALWASEGDYSWTYKTSIPHATFEITDDDEPYCRGIVFSMADIEVAK